MKIFIDIILVFFVIFFTIIYPLVFVNKNKINILIKLFNLIFLFIIINLMFNMISKKMPIYKKIICKFFKSDNTLNILNNEYYYY